MKGKTIVGIILAILLVIFALQNAEEVTIKLLSWSGAISAALLIIITYAMGVLTGILVSLKRKKKQPPVAKIEKTVSEEHPTGNPTK